ncbi:aldehyde dehydrogenase family protein [Nocardia pseudovaccinii]|uniref:aldehyde dehydrogenase family protein n=1 Tax=Nocardia pseudovaccinii TaxID=189540 RepID=UPI0007A3FA13|nr:aldehyde dehydrogenase family protein [Nocardia pseudovaccinii]
MAIVHPADDTTDGHRRLALASPLDGSPIDELEIATSAEVDHAVEKARAAQRNWAARGVAERAKIVRRAVQIVVDRREEIVATVRAETGKPRAEALMLEIVPACDFLNYWSVHARNVLRPRRQRLHGSLRMLKKLYIEELPLGVVGVITPWNAPFVLALNPVVQALLAGNTVVLKPSEVTPRSSEWVVRVLHEAGVPEDVVQVVHGDGRTGAALVDSDIDKVCFTGSVGTGHKISAACSQRLLPCTLELGGKDAMIVCADADLERAAAGAVYLSMFNTGQVCMSTERIYVVDSVADEFIRLVTEKAAAVTYGSRDADLGPLFWDRQLDVVSRHIDDAKNKGGQVVIGGAVDAGKGLYFQPTVVVDATHEMQLMTEETFGPVVAITRVRDEAQAIEKANDSRYGLSGSVFTKDPVKARRIARQMNTGSVCHNDGAVIYGVPEAPFGGRKESGLGRVNGTDGLRGYTHAQPVLIDRWQSSASSVWYPYSEKTIRNLESMIRFGYGTKLGRWLTS